VQAHAQENKNLNAKVKAHVPMQKRSSWEMPCRIVCVSGTAGPAEIVRVRAGILLYARVAFGCSNERLVCLYNLNDNMKTRRLTLQQVRKATDGVFGVPKQRNTAMRGRFRCN